jgi:hypothetical protein
LGISIVLEAKLPSQGLFTLKRAKIDWEAEVAASMKEFIVEYGLGDFVPVELERQTGRIPLHLCEEWAEISVGKKTLTIAARTSTCGPGFHAMFCAAIDRIEEKFKLKFFETEEAGDDTGYFLSRDFGALQNYFANWSRRLAESVVENWEDADNGMRLQLSIGQLVPDMKAGEVQTPRGPKTIAYLQSISTMNHDALLRAAEIWFPWWNVRPGSDDFLKMAEQVMWSDVPWRAPDNEYERQAFIAAISGLNRSKLLGGDISHFQRELEEMEFLTRVPDSEITTPSKVGIGYRRQNCRWELTPTWTGLLPGHLYTVSEEDNYQLYDNDFVVRVSGLSVTNSGDDFILSENEGEHEIIAEGIKEKFAWRIERSKEIDDAGWLTSFVLAGSKNSMLIATFSHITDFDQAKLVNFAESLSVSDPI